MSTVSIMVYSLNAVNINCSRNKLQPVAIVSIEIMMVPGKSETQYLHWIYINSFVELHDRLKIIALCMEYGYCALSVKLIEFLKKLVS